MPSKRTIILERLYDADTKYRAVLWADVPPGNQIAKRNPSATSAFENATPAELQAIRDGLVEEIEVVVTANSGASIAQVRALLDDQWTAWQAKVNAWAGAAEYGSYSNSSGVWQASPGVPMLAVRDTNGQLPTFWVMTPASAFGANKFHLVLYNGLSQTLGQCCPIRLRLLVFKPSATAVTGALPSAWTLKRRSSPTTPPSGAGGLTIVASDSSQPLPAGIAAWNAPGTPPAGGTLSPSFNEFTPQPDELKLTTADAPTLAAVLSSWHGQVVYDAAALGPMVKPLTLRAGETAEVQQGGTAGTGSGQMLCVFTTG